MTEKEEVNTIIVSKKVFNTMINDLHRLRSYELFMIVYQDHIHEAAISYLEKLKDEEK